MASTKTMGIDIWEQRDAVEIIALLVDRLGGMVEISPRDLAHLRTCGAELQTHTHLDPSRFVIEFRRPRPAQTDGVWRPEPHPDVRGQFVIAKYKEHGDASVIERTVHSENRWPYPAHRFTDETVAQRVADRLNEVPK